MSVPTPILQYNLSDATMKGLLPAGYTPLAYIEFPGSGGGIDLGYKFNALTDKYEIEFLAVSNTTQNGMILASSGSKYSWLYYYGNNGIRIYITDSNGTLRNSGNRPNDLHKHIVRYHDRKWYIDRGDSSATGTYESYSFVQDTNNLCLGDYSASQAYPFKGKIYRVKIWNNNILQRDLIPAAHSSGNGYYDLVTRVFYTRSGLIAGPELAIGKNGGKSLPEEYQLVEYLQMAPGLYINTGQAVAANDVTKTEAWMWYASGNTRDLMGWSASGANYWGCKADSTWENTSGVSPITQRQKVTYNYTAANAGTYQIGRLATNYSTRTKYIEQVKITIGSSLKRNLYACYRKSDMKPGMYDTVNGVFYTNAGSGEFILGPTITNCYTSEPNAGSGTLQGLYTNLSGIYDSSKGWVAGFNGSNYISTPGFSQNDIKSIALWVKTPNLNNLVWYCDAKAKTGLGIYSSNFIIGSRGRSLPIFGLNGFTANTWYHIAVVYNNTPELYINGVKYAGSSSNEWSSDDNNLMLIGTRLYNGALNLPFYGQISNFMLFNTALTAAQVKELYGK